MSWVAKAKKRKKKVPTNSPVAATKWFFMAWPLFLFPAMLSNGFSIGMIGVGLIKLEVDHKRSVVQQSTFTTKGRSSRYRSVKERCDSV
jgi:hypothetical protein